MTLVIVHYPNIKYNLYVDEIELQTTVNKYNELHDRINILMINEQLTTTNYLCNCTTFIKRANNSNTFYGLLINNYLQNFPLIP